MLTSEPDLELSVRLEVGGDDPAAPAFPADGFVAQQGFTEMEVTGGRYTIDHTRALVLRDWLAGARR